MSSIIDKKRERILMISIVGAVAFVGFGVGIRQKAAPAEYSSFSEEKGPPGVLAARSKKELAKDPWRADAPKWAPALGVASDPITPRNQEAYATALNPRTTARAFEGAPPTIPHPVGQGANVWSATRVERKSGQQQHRPFHTRPTRYAPSATCRSLVPCPPKVLRVIRSWRPATL